MFDIGNLTFRRATLSENSAERNSAALGLVAIVVFSGLANASLLCAPAIAMQLSRELGYEAKDIGLFFSMEFSGYCVAGVSGRWLMPRYDWRVIAMMALMGIVGGDILSIVVLHHYGLLLGVRLLTASCSALLGVATLSSASKRPDNTRAYGLYILAQCAAGVIGLAFLPTMFARFGLSSYFVLIAMCLVGGFWLLRTFSHGDGGSLRQSSVKLPAKLRLASWSTLLLFYIGLGGTWTFAATFAKRAGFDPVVSGRFMSLAALFGVIGAGMAAALGRSRKVALYIYGGYTFMVFSVLLLLCHQQWEFVVAIIAFKFTWTFVIPFIIALIGRLDSNGEMLAECTLMVGLGLAAAPWLAGQVVATKGLDHLVMTETGLLVISAASAIFLLRVTEHFRARPTAS
jgi:hypothetical protein